MESFFVEINNYKVNYQTTGIFLNLLIIILKHFFLHNSTIEEQDVDSSALYKKHMQFIHSFTISFYDIMNERAAYITEFNLRIIYLILSVEAEAQSGF